MSGSPPVISMLDEEDTQIMEHGVVIEKAKREKEEHQRQQEVEAWRQAEENERAQKEAKKA